MTHDLRRIPNDKDWIVLHNLISWKRYSRSGRLLSKSGDAKIPEILNWFSSYPGSKKETMMVNYLNPQVPFFKAASLHAPGADFHLCFSRLHIGFTVGLGFGVMPKIKHLRCTSKNLGAWMQTASQERSANLARKISSQSLMWSASCSCCLKRLTL